jgi:putative acetyltransferase
MIIRPARTNEQDALFRIWDDAVRATHHFLSEEDRAFFSSLVRDQYLPNASFWCAVDEADLPLAFLGMTGDRIDALFVAPHAHGQGVGRALVTHARKIAPGLSLDVNEQNEGAVAFYQRLGFQVIGRAETDDSGRPYPLLHMRLEEGA